MSNVNANKLRDIRDKALSEWNSSEGDKSILVYGLEALLHVADFGNLSVEETDLLTEAGKVIYKSYGNKKQSER